MIEFKKYIFVTTLLMMIWVTVTPLDVVRVRLQSQLPPSAQISPSGSSRYTPNTSGPPFNNLSPRLGVSACCREVFWVNNNADFCIASPTNLAVNGSSMSASVVESSAECAAEETQRRTFTSTLDGLRKIARNEGVTTLWRGLSPTLVMAVPANVIYFTGYDWLRYSHRSPIVNGVPESYAPLVAGSIARVVAAMAISPIEMFRTRLQASSSNGPSRAGSTQTLYLDTLSDLKELSRVQGYSALWRGLSLTLWRDVPFSGLYWWGYEMSREMLRDMRTSAWRPETIDVASSSQASPEPQESHTTTLVDSFAAGAISGAIASVITTPFDVGKTRQQVIQQAGDSVRSSSTTARAGNIMPEQQSMPRLLWHIFREEGAAGLWKGWAARCLKVAPACAIMISTYEIGKEMARAMNEKQEH